MFKDVKCDFCPLDGMYLHMEMGHVTLRCCVLAVCNECRGVMSSPAFAVLTDGSLDVQLLVYKA